MTFGASQANFLINSPAAVGQAVLTALKLWLGEWFLDQSQGVPYTSKVLGMGASQTIEPTLRAAILNVQGVQAIEELNVIINPVTRAVSVSGTLDTIYGTAQIAGVL